MFGCRTQECEPASINRNYAVSMSNGDHIVFIDSDVVLSKDALAYYNEDWTNFSERVIIGPYDWWPPMKVTKEDVQRVYNLSHTKLPNYRIMETILNPTQTFECAGITLPTYFSVTIPMSLNASGNMGISRKMFDYIGGFDEELPRAEDGPFA